MNEPTKRPWSQAGIAFPDSDRPWTNIWGPRASPDHQSGPMIAREVSLPDAELIVRAVNAHDDLLAVCRELLDSAEYWSDYDVPLGIVDRLRAAVEKAGE